MSVRTLGGPAKGIMGTAQFNLPNGTKIRIKHAIYKPDSDVNLISTFDLETSGFHHITTSEPKRLLHLFDENLSIVETCPADESRMYLTNIKPIQPMSFVAIANRITKSSESKAKLWHERLGHPGTSMFRKMLGNVRDLPITNFVIIYI